MKNDVLAFSPSSSDPRPSQTIAKPCQKLAKPAAVTTPKPARGLVWERGTGVVEVGKGKKRVFEGAFRFTQYVRNDSLETGREKRQGLERYVHITE